MWFCVQNFNNAESFAHDTSVIGVTFPVQTIWTLMMMMMLMMMTTAMMMAMMMTMLLMTLMMIASPFWTLLQTAWPPCICRRPASCRSRPSTFWSHSGARWGCSSWPCGRRPWTPIRRGSWGWWTCRCRTRCLNEFANCIITPHCAFVRALRPIGDWFRKSAGWGEKVTQL